MDLVPISTQVSTTAFQQTGTFDWSHIAQLSTQVPFRLAVSLAQGNVHTRTLLVAQYVSVFQIAKSGRDRFEQAIGKLKSFSSWGKQLQIGFGIESLCMQLSRSKQGMSCSAICAALAETYRLDFAAEILYEMTQLTNPPDDLVPSDSEWRQLIQTFQGVLTSSSFPLVVEHFRKKLPGEYQWPEREGRQIGNVCGSDRADAASIASILHTLKEVSWGRTHSVKVAGHHFDMAWIAAVSDWLLGLRTVVTVVKDSKTELIHRNCPTEADARVHLIFAVPETTYSTELTQLRTFVLTREDPDRLVMRGEINRYGRVEWKECLAITFGRGSALLFEHGKVVGTAVGCALRVHRGIIECKHPSEDGGYTGSSRLDIARFLTLQLPELSPYTDHIFYGASLSSAEARRVFEVEMSNVATTCDCSVCLCSDPGFFEPFPFADRCCLVSLVNTILYLACLLFRTQVEAGVFPTTAGLESIYHGRRDAIIQEKKDARIRRNNEARAATQSTSQSAELSGAYTRQLDNGLRAIEGPEGRLQAICSLFTLQQRQYGGSVSSTGRATSAIVRQGICVYLSGLMEIPELDSDGPVFQVVPGRIEYKKCPYPTVRTITTKGETAADSTSTQLLQWQLTLLVTPRDRVLDVVYCAKATRDMEFRFTPLDVFKGMQIVMYTDSCPQSGCAIEQVEVVAPGTCRNIEHQGKIIKLHADDGMALMMQLLSKAPIYGSVYEPDAPLFYIKRDCCMHCCLRFIAEHRQRFEVPASQTSRQVHVFSITS